MTGMDGSARAWLVVVAKDHYWRVAHWYEFDDLLQDGYMCWYRVVEKYETETGRVRSRPHLMRLFKITFLNHIHFLSKQRTVNSIEKLAGDLTDNPDPWATLAFPRDVNEYEHMIVEAPKLLQPLLRVLLADIPLPRLRSEYRVYLRRPGQQETTNVKLCGLVGISPHKYDLATALRTFLRG